MALERAVIALVQERAAGVEVQYLGHHAVEELAIDLALLSSHITPDRRIELKEGKILEATTNTLGQYILVVIGRQSSTDYQPLKDYIAKVLARPIKTRAPSASPGASP